MKREGGRGVIGFDLHTNHVCVCFLYGSVVFGVGDLNELLVKRQLMTAVGQIGRSSRNDDVYGDGDGMGV